MKTLVELQKFKDYVHERLTEMGVPQDPDPTQTKETGCRIGGRLDWINNHPPDLVKTEEGYKPRVFAYERVKLATRTEAPVTDEMLSRFQNTKTIRILHAVMGLSTEAGEALDALKKHLFYGKPLDELNIKEEMGDCDWYLNLLCSALDTTMALIEMANIKKLAARYGDKFSEDKALLRDLGVELQVLKDNLK